MKFLLAFLFILLSIFSFNSCNFPTGSGGTDSSNLSDINFNINVIHNIPTGSGGTDKRLLDLTNINRGNVKLTFGQSNENSFIPKEIVESKDFNKSLFDVFQSKIKINNAELVKPLNSFLYQLTIKDKSYIFSVSNQDIVNKAYNLTIAGLNENTNISIKLIPIIGSIKNENNNQFFKPEIKEDTIKNINIVVNKDKDIKKTEVIKVAIPSFLPIQTRNTNLCPKYCNDDSNFITDVTYPDNTIVKSNDQIKKIWAIQNSSTQRGVIWKNRVLKKSQDQVGGIDPNISNINDFYLKAEEESVQIPTTYPGQVILLEVNLTAPKYAVPVVRSTWKMFDESNQLVFPCLHGVYVQLNVQNENHLTNIYSDSDFEVITSPKKEDVLTGQKGIKKVWKIKNISKKKWLNRRLININEPIKSVMPNPVPIDISDQEFLDKYTNTGYLKPKDKIIIIPDALPGEEVEILTEVEAPQVPSDYIISSWKVIDSDGKFLFDDIEDLSFELSVNQPNNTSSKDKSPSCIK